LADEESLTQQDATRAALIGIKTSCSASSASGQRYFQHQAQGSVSSTLLVLAERVFWLRTIWPCSLPFQPRTQDYRCLARSGAVESEMSLFESPVLEPLG